MAGILAEAIQTQLITMEDRYLGCLIGLAVGDAVGTTVEFKSPGTFPPVTDMTGGGPFKLPPGAWTDDTSMALCLAESLLTCGAFNAQDQMERYLRWWKEGYLSSTGECFDIGNTVVSALHKFSQKGDPIAGATDARAAGNGSLMRLAPVPLFFASHPIRAIDISAESSKTTHGAETCLDACRYFSGLILGALQAVNKQELLADRFTPIDGYFKEKPLCREIDEVARGSFMTKEPPDIVGSGYVVKSLEAALWAFHHSSDFREGCLMAVNLGNDADTTAAIFGQIAGAYYGIKGIPHSWVDRIFHLEQLIDLANNLLNSKL